MKTFLYHENGWRMFQAERLPVKPDKFYVKQYMKFCTCECCQVVRDYESEIAALKAKSIPIENILVWKLWACQNILEEVLTSDIGIHEWPGDVEIKEELEYPIDHTSYPSYRQVAILTLPKEQQQ